MRIKTKVRIMEMGIRQKDLADWCGVAESTISAHINYGTPLDNEKIKLMCQLLKIDYDSYKEGKVKVIKETA